MADGSPLDSVRAQLVLLRLYNTVRVGSDFVFGLTG